MGKIGKLKALEQRVFELEAERAEKEMAEFANDPCDRLANSAFSALDFVDFTTYVLPEQQIGGRKLRGEILARLLDIGCAGDWTSAKLRFMVGLKTHTFTLDISDDELEQARWGYGGLRQWLNTANGDQELEEMRLDWAMEQLADLPEEKKKVILAELNLIPKPVADSPAGQLLPLSEPPSSPVEKRSEAVEVQPARAPSLVPLPMPGPKGSNVIQVRYIGNRAQNSFQLLTTTGMKNVSRGQVFTVDKEVFSHSLAGDREWQRV